MTLHLSDYRNEIISHYEKCWHKKPVIHTWKEGPTHKLPDNFSILEFAPLDKRDMWTYATCCMSQPSDISPIELHLFSSVKDEGLVELLTVMTYYHKNTTNLGLNHTVNFGRPWQGKSFCDHGLISLPYLDGPELEDMNATKFYWLIPVTKEEVEYKKKYGVTALEDKFEEKGLDYINASRKGVV
jgi:Suppressor of fused protein (SUFU).